MGCHSIIMLWKVKVLGIAGYTGVGYVYFTSENFDTV